MGVKPDHFGGHGGDDIAETVFIPFFGKCAKKEDLKKKVSQLLLEMFRNTLLYGVNDLISFLKQIAPDI